MSFRVMLYAEGPGEDGGESLWLPEPGSALTEEMLGPAHRLFTRVLARERRLPAEAIHYLSPLRLRARVPRGSDLLVKKHLRQLLTIADPTKRPDLAIVLVDEDGVRTRRNDLVHAIRAEPPLVQASAVAVAVREFEAWLLADPRAITQHLVVRETPPNPEAMKPREAKRLLRKWIDETLGSAGSSRTIESIRTALATTVDLACLDRLSSFSQFRQDVRIALPP